MTHASDTGTSTTWRADCLAVIVHYGEHRPTELIVRATATMGFKVVVVANDLSRDPRWLGVGYEWLVPTRNLGYGDGFNAAVRALPGFTYYLLANSDLVVGAATLDACRETLVRYDDVGVVAPRLVSRDGRTQHGPGMLSPVTRMPVNTRADATGIVFPTWVSGALMLIRGDAARSVPMDGSYFLGWEDADFCLALRDAGFRSAFRGDVSAIHDGGGVIGPWWYYYAARNPTWFAHAHRGRLRAAIVCGHTVLRLPRVIAADVVKRRGLSRCRFAARGVRDSFKTKPTKSEGPWLSEPVPMSRGGDGRRG